MSTQRLQDSRIESGTLQWRAEGLVWRWHPPIVPRTVDLSVRPAKIHSVGKEILPLDGEYRKWENLQLFKARCLLCVLEYHLTTLPNDSVSWPAQKLKRTGLMLL